MTKSTLETITKANHLVFVKITDTKGTEFVRTNSGFTAKPTKAQAKKSAGFEVLEMFKGKFDRISKIEYGYMTKGREVVLSWDDLTEVKTTYINPSKVKTTKIHKFFE